MSRVDKGKKLLLFLADENLSNLESFLEKYEIDNEEEDTETPKFMEAIKHLLNVGYSLVEGSCATRGNISDKKIRTLDAVDINAKS